MPNDTAIRRNGLYGQTRSSADSGRQRSSSSTPWNATMGRASFTPPARSGCRVGGLL